MNRNSLSRRRALMFAACAGLCAIRGAAAQTRLGFAVRGGLGAEGNHIHMGPSAVDFSRDSRLLALPCGDNQVMLWDLYERKEAARLERAGAKDKQAMLDAACFLGDTRTIAAVFSDAERRGARIAELVLFDVAMRAQRASISLADVGVPRCMAFSPDGKRALIATELARRRKSATEVTLWNLETAAPIKTLDTAPSCTSVAISPDGRWLAAVHGQSDTKGQLILWDAATLERHRLLRADGGWLTLAFSPDSKSIAAGANRHWKSPLDYFTKVWDVESGRERGVVEADVGDERVQWNVVPLFSPDSQLLASICTRSRHPPETHLELSIVASGEQRVLARGKGYWASCADFSPDGAILAAAVYHDTPEVTLWDTKYWRELRRLDMARKTREKFLNESVGWLRFSPDGKWLAAMRKDSWYQGGPPKHEVLIWNMEEALGGTSESRSPGLDR